jgi:hypothetical protein
VTQPQWLVPWAGDDQGSALPLVGEVERLRAELAAEGVDRVVLCGMGGSSLAPEVIARADGVPLVVLDSTDPDQVQAALVELDRTVVVVSSKSGSTGETDSHHRAFEAAFAAAGIDAASRIVVVTDPGSPLERAGLDAGYRAVFRADPQVGGRFSALSAFGIVPAGLARATQLRRTLAARTRRPVTFGWGPRFLHSTGQFHKGGPAIGVHLQLTAAPDAELPVPDRPFSFGRLIAAQAAGDAQVLAELGRPVLRLHLRDRSAGLAQLVIAAGADL